MIFRRKLPMAGEKRTLTRRAWWPKRFVYEQETVTIWLSQYCVEQRYYVAFGPNSSVMCSSHMGSMMDKGDHWCDTRCLTLADACLEKLNPKPEAPQPTQSAFAAPMAQQAALLSSPQTLLGGMPSQGYYPNVWAQSAQQLVKKAGTP